ncbi:hypothetical protein GF406_18880 [candidate division KSB1 bacterium]|nr:hypothetical protein [candidate division KSB1 bacterium]
MASKSPAFIIGRYRSGTKLLRTLLNRHTQICFCGYEYPGLVYLLQHWQQFGDLSVPENFKRFYAESRVQDLISVHQWYTRIRDFSPTGIFEALVRVTSCDVDEMNIWGIKSPLYMEYIPLLNSAFPGAKFIHILRDPRDTVLSEDKFGFKDYVSILDKDLILTIWEDLSHSVGRKIMINRAMHWRRHIEQAQQQAYEVKADFIQIRYEDLLLYTEKTLMQVCTFLNLSYQQQMSRLDSPVQKEHYGDATNTVGIVKDNFGKYQFKIHPSVLTKIELGLNDLLTQNGYPAPQHPGEYRHSSWKRIYHVLHDKFWLYLILFKKAGPYRTIRSFLYMESFYLRKKIRDMQRRWRLFNTFRLSLNRYR